jgi:hypothetical protein
MFSGYTINILGDEDQNSHRCKAYSYYSSPSTHNGLIWASRIAHVAYVPEVFDYEEVVSWCVLTFSFGLFCLPCNIFHLLPHGKLVITINFTTRMGSYDLFHLKNYGFLSCWGATLEQCQRQEHECCSPTSSQGFIPLWNHSLVSLSPQVFLKILRLRQRTLTF